jgi:ribosomal protein S18 acetylase RimI-like enzyme
MHARTPLLLETVSQADRQTIERVWSRRWGLPVCTPTGQWRPEDVEGLLIARGANELGLVTWRLTGREAEIVTLNVLEESGRAGRTEHALQLLRAAEQALVERGVRRACLFATNDSICAVGFYQRHGYRLVKLHLDAVAQARRHKPEIPLQGEDGIVLVDYWELVKDLRR